MIYSILIVDDDDDLRTIMKLILSDYTLSEASNGHEAVQLYQEKRYDLILMDIVMPVMNGIEAIELIKQIDSNANIMVMTAYTPDIDKIFALGVGEILKKPVKRVELLSIVELSLKN